LRHYKNLDVWSLIVIVVTFSLFALALIEKDLTHDVLLESGVFLVPVKLIMLAHRNNDTRESIEAKLDAIYNALLTRDECNRPDEE